MHDIGEGKQTSNGFEMVVDVDGDDGDDGDDQYCWLSVEQRGLILDLHRHCHDDNHDYEQDGGEEGGGGTLCARGTPASFPVFIKIRAGPNRDQIGLVNDVAFRLGELRLNLFKKNGNLRGDQFGHFLSSLQNSRIMHCLFYDYLHNDIPPNKER